jgi:hypothetical protein
MQYRDIYICVFHSFKFFLHSPLYFYVLAGLNHDNEAWFLNEPFLTNMLEIG